jgi:hypothetical protein
VIGHEDNTTSIRFGLLDPKPAIDRWHEESEETFDQAAAAQPANAGVEESNGAFGAAAPAHSQSAWGVEESEETFGSSAAANPVESYETFSPPARPSTAAETSAWAPIAQVTERVPDPEIARLREEAAGRIAAAEQMEREALIRRRQAEDRQSETWALEQQRRFTQRLDEMLAAEAAEIAERQLREKDVLSAWGQAERERIQGELVAEEQHFHDRLLRQLEEFEFQLGERLREQEERMGRWIAEAERIVDQRTRARRS